MDWNLNFNGLRVVILKRRFYVFRFHKIMYASNLAQHRDRWRFLVKAIMNHQVPKNVRSILTN
jgi:hypothetical protein